MDRYPGVVDFIATKLRAAKQLLLLATIISLLFVGGCSFSLGAGVGQRSYYVLNELPSTIKVNTTVAGHIAVRRSAANRFIDSHKILFTDNPAILQFYQLASWVDTPAEYLTGIVSRKLERSGCFSSVLRAGQGTTDFVLETEILDFYHDTSDRPGMAVVRIGAVLLDSAKGSVVAKSEFAKTVELSTFDAAGAVLGLQQALNLVVDEMIVWIAQSAERP